MEFQVIVELVTPEIDIVVLQPFPIVLSGEPIGPAIEVILNCIGLFPGLHIVSLIGPGPLRQIGEPRAT